MNEVRTADLFVEQSVRFFLQEETVMSTHSTNALAKKPVMPEAVWQQVLASMERELEQLVRRHEQ